MNTLETDAEIMPDGSVKLLSPLPAWLTPGRAHVLLVVTENGNPPARKREAVKATPEMLARRKVALAALREPGGLADAIPDPAAWQREVRQDRPLPGRS